MLCPWYDAGKVRRWRTEIRTYEFQVSGMAQPWANRIVGQSARLDGAPIGLAAD